MNTMLSRTLFVVAAAPTNSNLCCKRFLTHSFHFRNAFSTEAHSQTLFLQFASTKLELSAADISWILKRRPQLQNLRNLHNVEKVIHSLKKHGCTEAQIAKILRGHCQLIGSAETILEPKLKLLEDFGFVDQNLAKLMTRNPCFLSNSLENNIFPTMEFLKNVFQSQGVFIKALLRAPRLLSYSLEKTLKPSLSFWEGWGFSGAKLVSFLQTNPNVLQRTSLTPGQMDLINKIGIDKESKIFKYILGIVAMGRTETLEAKIENLKLCGLSVEEIRQLLGAVPLVLCFSKESVSEKMNFIVNNMELSVHHVVKHPWLLQISLEKTMRPRFLVWQKIKSINALELPLLTLLTMTEAKFVHNIIKGHAESKLLWTIYENAISNASNRTKNSTKENFE
ncbi:transcription termination factor MTERF9, chloroplastic [Cryptomeria japonica]|uniref:transcription termination factor MTERF9, chloroplastic n=1 Tax=Cryptomeria japonica TaxID=3369 RepID=UPI0027DA30D2|nr:transcription termination factor MTERF9, chloroplastic [Cryptomeria japonica]XP_057832873.2 transcription termination factor MTERF9, chloroplastic [Cryptomeria japonica]